jgi:hypothetical protein
LFIALLTLIYKEKKFLNLANKFNINSMATFFSGSCCKKERKDITFKLNSNHLYLLNVLPGVTFIFALWFTEAFGPCLGCGPLEQKS